VARVGDEPGLAVDPALHRVHHVVEGDGQRRQVRVVARCEARGQVTRGDPLRGAGEGRHRPEHQPAQPEAEQRAEHPGERAPDDQRVAEGRERGVELVHREDLEVLGVDRLQRQSDREPPATSGDRAHVGDVTLGHDVPQCGRDRAPAGRHRGAVGPSVDRDDDDRVAGEIERPQRLADLVSLLELVAQDPGVDERAAQQRLLALIDEVALGERVERDPEQADDGHRRDRERGGDAEPEPARLVPPTGRLRRGHDTSRYPSPRTVSSNSGLLGSFSIFVRSR
jgi:hypothetical protein